MRYLYAMLVFLPAALAARFLALDPAWVFAASALAIIPLAAILGRATEELAVHTGPSGCALLNATFGNAAELIITIVALREGLLEVVKASITGSIIGNLLLIMGLSFLVGGLRNGIQRFDRRESSMAAAMMTLAVIGLAIPAVFAHAIEAQSHDAVEYLSIGVAVALMAGYFLHLLYSFRAGGTAASGTGQEPDGREHWGLWASLGVLLASTAGIVAMSELLVTSMEPMITGLGLTELFVGVILVPIIGNAAEHMVAVQVAHKDQMNLSMGISLGSSTQIALLVAPLLVFVSLAMGNPMSLIFNPFELAALAAAVGIAALISLDGESNWLEGAQLLIVYVIVGLAFFFLPI